LDGGKRRRGNKLNGGWNYRILCVKRERGVILLGDFWPKSSPNGMEDRDIATFRKEW
jgi:hypothetical protein